MISSSFREQTIGDLLNFTAAALLSRRVVERGAREEGEQKQVLTPTIAISLC